MLSLTDNSLEVLLPRMFQQLAKLKHLDLSGNPIDDLVPDIFRDITVSPGLDYFQHYQLMTSVLPPSRISGRSSVVGADSKRSTHTSIICWGSWQSLISGIIR